MNLKTKVLIITFVFLSVVYFLDKFFDVYTFVSPIKKLEFQFFLQKRETRTKHIKNAQKMPLKSTEGNISGLEKNEKNLPEKGQNLSKFSGIKLYHDRILGGYEAIYIYFGKEQMAYAVAMAESGIRCDVVSKTDDYGLFQINKVHMWRFKKFGGDPLNCWDNARVAREIYEEQGWRAWSAYLNKSYKLFLN